MNTFESVSSFSNFLKFKNIFGMNVMQNRSDFWLQFPIKLSHHHDKTAADHLGLNYVTERILASVLPNLSHQQQQHRQQQQQLKQARDNGFNNDGPHIVEPVLDESPQDIYEQELISMLEQKHGKVNTDFFFLPLSRCRTHFSFDCKCNQSFVVQKLNHSFFAWRKSDCYQVIFHVFICSFNI